MEKSIIAVSVKENFSSLIYDKEIGDRVDPNFWDDVQNYLNDCFSEGNHAEGVVGAIKRIAEPLAEYFPISPDDVDEIDNRPEIVD